MAHTASTVQRLLEDGSIKASSVAPNEMYQCHYLAHGTCFCKSPFVPGAGSSGGNRDWNSYIVAGQTPPSDLTKSGMERANLEVNSAFMLYETLSNSSWCEAQVWRQCSAVHTGVEHKTNILASCTEWN